MYYNVPPAVSVAIAAFAHLHRYSSVYSLHRCCNLSFVVEKYYVLSPGNYCYTSLGSRQNADTSLRFSKHFI